MHECRENVCVVNDHYCRYVISVGAPGHSQVPTPMGMSPGVFTRANGEYFSLKSMQFFFTTIIKLLMK